DTTGLLQTEGNSGTIATGGTVLRDLFSLFPAYAGVILCYCVDIRNSKSFPRMRGGDPCNANFRGMMDYFSPHTRG
ncbi:MAG: hypothetical protein U0M24_04430, partial [Faecalibacterium prausnitzii]|nr:hypothetical protein [Faecalibacterium prausnitzii]